MSTTGVRRRWEDQEDCKEQPLAKRSATEEEAQTSNEAITEALTCPLCGDWFSSPVTLPRCTHTFCQHCLNSLPLSHVQGGKLVLKCSLCYQLNEKPLNGWKIMEGNAYKIVEAVRTHKSQLALPNRSTPGQGNSETQVCPHLPTKDSGHEKCIHCKHDFCSTCRLLHMKSLKEEILKDAEQVLKDNENFSGEKTLADLKKALDDASLEAQTKLIAAVEKLRKKLDKVLTEITSELAQKMPKFSHECIKQLKPNITALDDKAAIGCLKDEFSRISNTDIESMSMTDLAKFHATLFDRKKKVASFVGPPGLLFKLENSFDRKKVKRCCEVLKTLPFGTLEFNADELFGVRPEPSYDAKHLQLTQWHLDDSPHCCEGSYHCQRRRYSDDEEEAEEEEEASSSDDSTGGDADDGTGIVDEGGEDEAAECECECKCAMKIEPSEPDEVVITEVESLPQPTAARVNSAEAQLKVNFEYKNLNSPKCVAALANSCDSEFAVLHSSNHLAVFNSNGLYCDLKLPEISGEAKVDLEIDAVYPSNGHGRRLFATGTVGKSIRKIYLISLALTKSVNSACLYEIASSNDLRDFPTLLSDGSDEKIFTTSGHGELLAYYPIAGQEVRQTGGDNSIRKFIIGHIGVGVRLHGFMEEKNSCAIIFSTNRKCVSMVQMTWKPKNVNKKFAMGDVSPLSDVIPDGGEFHTFNYGHRKALMTIGSEMQVFEVDRYWRYSMNRSVTIKLPVDKCVGLAMLSSKKQTQSNYSVFGYRYSRYQESKSPTAVALLSNTGVISVVTLPN